MINEIRIRWDKMNEMSTKRRAHRHRHEMKWDHQYLSALKYTDIHCWVSKNVIENIPNDTF